MLSILSMNFGKVLNLIRVNNGGILKVLLEILRETNGSIRILTEVLEKVIKYFSRTIYG